jgi:peptidoglycan hydrolase CwlO-like protein
MKTLKPLILTFLIITSIITFAFNYPKNEINTFYNFGINDTIDTLTILDLDNLFDEDLENANKDLENANKDLENANKDIENANKDIENANKDIENANKELENANKELETVNTIDSLLNGKPNPPKK